MQTQDASAEFLIKFWPWLEANRQRLIATAVAVVVVLFFWYYIDTQKEQKAINAGQAYTQLQLSMAPNPTVQQVSDAFVQLAQKYPGTIAAERAQLQASSVLFDAGRYADAQAQFQKFLDANHGSSLAAAAQLGVAASLEAQNKLADAATAYRMVTTSYPNSAEALPAKFSLGSVLEAQGKATEAMGYFQEVARTQLAGLLASEAAQRLAKMQAATKPAAKS
jgi:predicted negative regulator of RcsB-dependent stress response